MPLEREHMIMATLPCWTWQGPFPGRGGAGGTGESVGAHEEQEEQKKQTGGRDGLRSHKCRSAGSSRPLGPRTKLTRGERPGIFTEPSRAGVKKTRQKPPAASAEPSRAGVKKTRQKPPTRSSGNKGKWWEREHEDWR